MNRWRGGAVARRGRATALAVLLLALAGGGCSKTRTPVPAGPPRNPDAAVFQECDSVCVRPGDCARAFNDDGICPAGFLCVLRYTGCNAD
jgi:hypothetical protein